MSGNETTASYGVVSLLIEVEGGSGVDGGVNLRNWSLPVSRTFILRDLVVEN